MAIQLKDRILTLCTTTGTNDAIVGETKEGYQGWEGITVGNTVSGNLLYFTALDSPKTILTGDQLKINANQLQLTLT